MSHINDPLDPKRYYNEGSKTADPQPNSTIMVPYKESPNLVYMPPEELILSNILRELKEIKAMLEVLSGNKDNQRCTYCGGQTPGFGNCDCAERV